MKLHAAHALILVFMSLTAHARGGLSGSGGGSGVACFPSKEIAQEAAKYLDHSQLLPDSLLSQASIQVLESWEQEKTGEKTLAPAPQQTWENYLEQIKTNVRKQYPLFMYRVDLTSKLLEKWDPVDEVEGKALALLEDADPIADIPAECKRIQIVIRDSKGDNALGEGPVDKLPKITVNYVKRYFDRLSVEDKAKLHFHEQLYILGKGIGHAKSDHIREIIRKFFSLAYAEESAEKMIVLRTASSRETKLKLIAYFGDYIKWFLESHPIEPGVQFTAQHHLHTYLQFIYKFGEKQGRCVRQALIEGTNPGKCIYQVMNPLWMSEELSEETAFVFVVMHGLDGSLGLIGDHALNPVPEAEPLFKQTMEFFCIAGPEVISRHGPRGMERTVAVRKFGDYCKLWLASRKPRE